MIWVNVINQTEKGEPGTSISRPSGSSTVARRSDELALRRRQLPWVRIDKEYVFDVEAVGWVKRCPNPMPGPSEIEIRPLYELADLLSGSDAGDRP